MLELVDTWGPKLFAVAVIYAIVSLIVTYSLISVGIEPPPLVPKSMLDLFKSAEETWSKMAGKVYAGGTILQLLGLLVNSITKMSIAIFGTIVVTYIWIAVLASAALPPPLNILVIPMWIAAVFANTILIIYIATRIKNMVTSIAGI